MGSDSHRNRFEQFIRAPWLGYLVALLVGLGLLSLQAGRGIDRVRLQGARETAVTAVQGLAYALSLENPEAAQQLVVRGRLVPAGGRLLAVRSSRYVIHSDPERVGQKLQPDSLEDKAVYDLSRRVLAAFKADPVVPGAVVFERSDASQPPAQVAVPVLRDSGRPRTTVILGYPDPPVHPSPPWKTWIGLLAAGLLAIPLAALRRNPALVAGALILLIALGCLHFSLQQQVHGEAELRLQGRERARSERLESLVAGGLLPDGEEDLGSYLGRHQGGRLQSRFDRSDPSRSPGDRLVTALCLTAALGLHLLIGTGGLARLLRILRDHRFAYLAIFPAMLGMGGLILLPFGYGISLSFFEVRQGVWELVWLRNFVEILSALSWEPDGFYFTLAVTVMWTVLNVVCHVGIGLALALVLNRPDLRLRRLYRILLILPWAVPSYITALIWKGMFHKQFGTVNALLGLVGIQPISWFGSFWPAFAANVITNVWLGFSFMMVISLGALQSIPHELYEAAQVDGAGRWHQFRSITIPLLKPALFPAVILGTIWTFNQFNVIYLVSGGAPAGATDILIVDAYRWAFQKYAYGYAAAYSVVIFLILLTYSLVTNRVTRATEGAFD